MLVWNVRVLEKRAGNSGGGGVDGEGEERVTVGGCWVGGRRWGQLFGPGLAFYPVTDRLILILAVSPCSCPVLVPVLVSALVRSLADATTTSLAAPTGSCP